MARKPFGQWPMWIGISGRDEMLKTSRGRYILSVQALVYGLNEVNEVRCRVRSFKVSVRV